MGKFFIKSSFFPITAILIITLIFGQRLLLNIKLKRNLSAQQYEQQQSKQERYQKYQRLIAEQAERHQQKQTKKSNERQDSQSQALVGEHELTLVISKPARLQAGSYNHLLNQLNSNKPFISFQYIKDFLQQQLNKHSSQKLDVQVEMFQPVQTIEDLTKVGDMANYWGKDPFTTSQLQDQFENLLEINGLKAELNSHHKAIVLYLDPYLSATHLDNSDRFYDLKTFRSFADESRHAAYINVYRTDPSFASTLIEIIIHEYLHLYGAKDKYLETEYGCTSEGKGDLSLPDLAPQDSTDIMCGLVETGYDDYLPGKLEEENITINKITASEIGWRD